jgi:drug/metabolite transporter (DMT)-like permease
VFLSLAAALAAAFCYGIGAVMQAIAVRAASRRPALEAAGEVGRVDPGLVIRMFRQWPFVVSLLIDFGGFICQLIALRRLPIFEVQVIIAANLAVTAVFASWLMHTVLSAREWSAVLAVVVGVGLLGSSAGAEGAKTVGIDFHFALIAALAVIAVAGVAAARLPSPFRTPALGAIAGLGYGVLAVCARILPGFTPEVLVKSPAAYTLAASGIISFMLYASALESGSVTVATAAVILLETVPPAFIGVLFLGDKTRPGMVGPAIAGFILALVSAIALARFGEAGGDKAEAGRPGAPAASQPIAIPAADRDGTEVVGASRLARPMVTSLAGSNGPAAAIAPAGLSPAVPGRAATGPVATNPVATGPVASGPVGSGLIATGTAVTGSQSANRPSVTSGEAVTSGSAHGSSADPPGQGYYQRASAGSVGGGMAGSNGAISPTEPEPPQSDPSDRDKPS